MFDFSLADLEKIILSKDPVSVILDTDTYNEVDDQFCLAYLMKSPERIRLLSVNAAPFLNHLSDSAEDGMEKSYNEIFKVMKLVDENAKIPVYRGSRHFLRDKITPEESDAADNIIKTVKESIEPVVIVAIGAITNVASALIKWPALALHAGLIWLGGNALDWADNNEFNLKQDPAAAAVVFDSGIPLLQIPCVGVCTEFITTMPELNHYLAGKSALCDYLVSNVASHERGRMAWSRVIWDVTAAGVLLCPQGFSIVRIPRPIVTPVNYYAFDAARPPYLYVRKLYRDPIYADLFKKLLR